MFHYAILLLLLRCCHIDGLNYTFIALFLMPLEQKHPATISLHCFFLFNTCFFPLLRCEFSYVVDCFFFVRFCTFFIFTRKNEFFYSKRMNIATNEMKRKKMKNKATIHPTYILLSVCAAHINFCQFHHQTSILKLWRWDEMRWEKNVNRTTRVYVCVLFMAYDFKLLICIMI